MNPIALFSLFYHHFHVLIFNDELRFLDIWGKLGRNCHHIMTIIVINKETIIIGTNTQFIGDKWGIHIFYIYN